MFRTILCFVSLLLFAGIAAAEEATETNSERRLGMSIVGNDEAPKSLVIVPWKSSELGDMLDVSRALDDGRQPVDRDVFKRQLDYYQIRLTPAAMRVSGKQ
jgi:hypothetical protein